MKKGEKISKEKTIKNSNFFIMERPTELNDHSLIIKTEEYHQEESKIAELMYDALYDVVLNVSDRLQAEDYVTALKMVTPTFALQMFASDSEQCMEVINKFLKEEKNKKLLEYVKSIPEEVSQLEFVVRFNFTLFYQDKNKIGLNEAIKKYKFFLDDVEDIFNMLPVCYAFNLVDFLVDCETKYKKASKK